MLHCFYDTIILSTYPLYILGVKISDLVLLKVIKSKMAALSVLSQIQISQQSRLGVWEFSSCIFFLLKLSVCEYFSAKSLP